MKKKLPRHPSTGLHRCMHPQCETVITTNRAFCLIHWRNLSEELKGKLNAAFRHYLSHQVDALAELRQVQAECCLYLVGEWDRRQTS